MNAIAHASASPVRGPKLDNRRVMAGVVDLAIVALGAAVVLIAGDALGGDASEVRGALSAVVLGWALYYYFALESGDGQTVGKKLMKLRVVRADGSPVGMREVAVRTVLRVVDGAGAYIVGLIVMLATGEKRQRLGDLAAGTIVVDASSAPVAPAAAAPAAEAVDEEAGVEGSDGDVEAPSATATITLPSRPAPATVSDLAAPEDPEAALVVDAEPVVEEPATPVDDHVTDELPDVTSPAVEALAEDVAAVQAEAPAAEVAPEFRAEQVIDAPVEDEEEEEPVEDAPVTVKSVETVSAIDLVMGGADAGQDDGDHAEEPASA